ncbi:TIGR02444 family protein [Kineobactrum salinum]|uniref:TIGR02444 family protein n=1 Tax=Kineobactrum salinum TaxID=2708301 RepID=A0A6C0TZR1_9GAMM|nr:TIGR02444 family protein [Kineobactrum salinum]QIB65246.1 TIGR02444 family protein [Kineobactrum salinum]
MSNPLWEFSLQQYGKPDVAEACLEAQDRFAANVNLLLYAAWLTCQGLELDAGQWRSLESELQPWHQQVVVPLRELRRRWRQVPAAAGLRQQLKVLELEAEQEQQRQIWGWHQRARAQDAGPAGLRRQLEQLLSAAADDSERSRLLQRLTVLLLA